MIDKEITGKYADIAYRLRAMRAYFDVSQKQFAEDADIPQKSYSQYENGDQRLSLSNAIRLRQKYGISMDFLYLGSVDTLPIRLAKAASSNPRLRNSSKSTDSPDTKAAAKKSSNL